MLVWFFPASHIKSLYTNILINKSIKRLEIYPQRNKYYLIFNFLILFRFIKKM